jgi:hypothetical protein
MMTYCFSEEGGGSMKSLRSPFRAKPRTTFAGKGLMSEIPDKEAKLRQNH